MDDLYWKEKQTSSRYTETFKAYDQDKLKNTYNSLPIIGSDHLPVICEMTLK